MITRLSDNILHKIAMNKISSEPDSSSSWFVQVRHLCTQYGLQSPLSLLLNPPTKHTFKSMVKSKITFFWNNKYEAEAQTRTSLEFFKPKFMSLLKPHPLWTTSKCNPFESNKSLVVSKFLSGQYPSDWFCRRWSKTNPAGSCLLCPSQDTPGDLQHLLVGCCSLQLKRDDIYDYWNKQTLEKPNLQRLLQSMIAKTSRDLCQFLLDPSVVPEVISGCQQELFSLDDIFSLTKTFVYAIHRRRLQMLGRFNIHS